MAFKDALLPEFDHEAALTRKCLERLPEDKLDWRPHEKSWTLQQLANHLANLYSWADYTMQTDFLDLKPPEGEGFKPVILNSRQEILDAFEKNVAASRKAIDSATDEALLKPWTLKAGEQTIFTMPRIGVLRSTVMNHIIHHRGQFTIYLRLNNVPVPSIYGPSADEQTSF